jgi:hypothetical protein
MLCEATRLQIPSPLPMYMYDFRCIAHAHKLITSHISSHSTSLCCQRHNSTHPILHNQKKFDLIRQVITYTPSAIQDSYSISYASHAPRRHNPEERLRNRIRIPEQKPCRDVIQPREDKRPGTTRRGLG